MIPKCGNVWFFLMQWSINSVLKDFSSPQTKNLSGKGRERVIRGGIVLASPLINIFQPLLIILFLFIHRLLCFQGSWNKKLGSQRGLADV